MLFLLVQLTINSPDCPDGIGVSNPWTEYVRMLPSTVPVPTTWNEEELMALIGTSLEVRGFVSYILHLIIFSLKPSLFLLAFHADAIF